MDGERDFVGGIVHLGTDNGAATGTKETNDDHVLTLSMARDEAAPEVIEIKIPAGYSLGGGAAAEGTVLGVLQAVLDTDNPFDSGNEIFFGGVIVATADPDEWALVVDYNFNASSASTNFVVKDSAEALRKHIIEVARPGGGSGGTLTINFARGSDPEANESTETWTLTLFGTADKRLTTNLNIPTGKLADDGTDPLNRTADSSETGFNSSGTSGWGINTAGLTLPSGVGVTVNLLKNPSTSAVYRWSAAEHSTIDPVVGDTLFFNDLPGSQGVLIK